MHIYVIPILHENISLPSVAAYTSVDIVYVLFSLSINVPSNFPPSYVTLFIFCHEVFQTYPGLYKHIHE